MQPATLSSELSAIRDRVVGAALRRGSTIVLLSYQPLGCILIVQDEDSSARAEDFGIPNVKHFANLNADAKSIMPPAWRLTVDVMLYGAENVAIVDPFILAGADESIQSPAVQEEIRHRVSAAYDNSLSVLSVAAVNTFRWRRMVHRVAAEAHCAASALAGHPRLLAGQAHFYDGTIFQPLELPHALSAPFSALAELQDLARRNLGVADSLDGAKRARALLKALPREDVRMPTGSAPGKRSDPASSRIVETLRLATNPALASCLGKTVPTTNAGEPLNWPQRMSLQDIGVPAARQDEDEFLL